MKHAGLMKPPPMLTQDVYEHIISQVASNYVKALNRKVRELKKHRETEADSIKEKIKGFKKLISVKLKPMKKDEVRKVQFPIYLDDWYVSQQMLDEHRELITKEKTESLNQMRGMLKELKDKDALKSIFDTIENSLRSIPNLIENLPYLNVEIQVSNETAHWQPEDHTFFMPIKDAENEVDGSGIMPEARWVVKEVKRVVIHEMTHAGQTILSRIKFKLDSNLDYLNRNLKSTLAGMPSRKIKTPQYKQDRGIKNLGQNLERHHLDDVEFYTDLRDATRDLMERIKRHEESGVEYGRPLKTQDKKLLFKALVGEKITREEMKGSYFLRNIRPIGFFLSLKRKAKPKYFKAVGEAYKLVFNSFAHQRMAERIARVHLERKKWVEAPPRQFDQNQQEQIWTIYDLSYSKVGKHISSKSALMSNYDLFWVIDVEGDKEIDAFVSYSSTPFGKKIGLIGSDGTSVGRNAMLMKGAELLLKRGWYAEVDSRFARLLKKRLGVNHVQDENQVRTIINKPLEWDDDKKCYTRNLEGKGEVVKYLVGLPSI